MKSLILYYSYSGNTRKIAQELAGYLKRQGSVDCVELKSLDESDNFFKQGERAFKRVRAKLAEVNWDMQQFDTVCLGTPVWAFAPTPAMNACVDNLSGLEGKRVVMFTTSGGAGDVRAMDYLEKILSSKGVKEFRRFSVSRGKVKNKDFILSQIEAALA